MKIKKNSKNTTRQIL